MITGDPKRPLQFTFLTQDESYRYYQGSDNHTLHLLPPPCIGFWSLTLYNTSDEFLPANLSKYSVGDRTQGLVYNESEFHSNCLSVSTWRYGLHTCMKSFIRIYHTFGCLRWSWIEKGKKRLGIKREIDLECYIAYNVMLGRCLQTVPSSFIFSQIAPVLISNRIGSPHPPTPLSNCGCGHTNLERLLRTEHTGRMP